MKLQGKIALVTGAAHRVGRAIALELAKEGADVVLHYGASAAAAQETAAEIRALGRNVLLHQADMGSWPAAEALGAAALAWQGRIDLLINSAATFNTSGLLDAAEADFDMAFGVNVKGAFALSRVVGAAMLNAEGVSCIVNIVDEGAFYRWKGYVAHGMSKAALLAMTRAQALNLRVNAVCPGIVDTALVRATTGAWGETDTVLERFRLASPLQRHVGPEDIAASAAFLMSADAAKITGAALLVDGGAHEA